MKSIVRMNLIGMVVVGLLASCMHETCPTYSGSKRSSGYTASTKKQKDNKGRTPYYKTMKKAEQD
jgi:hypothetical protein